MVMGLALQDTLGNLFSGLALQTEKLFQVGEWISFREHVGQVVGMTWKSTLIKTLENEIVYIPNNVISKEIVKNYSRPELSHVAYIEIGIQYEAPPNKVREVILDVLAENEKVLKVPPSQVRLINFGDHAITYQIRFWNNDFGGERLLKAEIMNQIWYALKRNGIEIPFPIRDVRLHHVTMHEAKRQQAGVKAEILSSLKRVEVLGQLPAEDVDLLASRVNIETYGNGEAIVHQGEDGDSMYIIHRGACDVYLEDEARKYVATLNAGDFFGEMSLLTGERRTATVVAKGDTDVFVIDKRSFSDILKEHPGFSEILGQALVRRQAELATRQGKKEEPSASAASQVVSRIKSFFGLG
jgi:CRP-like cAMP-binding protein